MNYTQKSPEKEGFSPHFPGLSCLEAVARSARNPFPEVGTRFYRVAAARIIGPGKAEFVDFAVSHLEEAATEHSGRVCLTTVRTAEGRANG